MLILAVDPGLTIGMAFNVNGFYETLDQPDARELYEFIASTPLDVVVCEQFITSNIHSNKYGVRTAEIVGGVEAVCCIKKIPFRRRNNVQRLPSMEKAKEILRSKRRQFVDHEVDALAHLLQWEKFNATKRV